MHRLLLLLLFSLPALAQDPFEQGMQAFEEQDYTTAAAQFETLARQGDPDAQYMLGRLYTRGNGVIQDFISAHMWFNLAAAGGHRRAIAARDTVAERMTAEQLASAQQAARRFREDQSLLPADVPVGNLNDIPPRTVRLSPEEPIPEAPPPVDQATVARIQLALSQQGYAIGPITGVVDEALSEAILDYQLTHFMPVDGQPSEELLARLLGEAGSTPAIAPGAQLSDPVVEQPWIWRRILIQDGFRDGNFEANPAWEVTSGRFWVEAGRGLRSVGETIDNAPPAQILLPQPINNAFAIDFELVSRQNQGRLELGPYQSNPSSGYRLVYYPANATGFELRAIAPSGSAVIARSQRRFDLEQGGVHRLLWTRDGQGRMVVTLNDTVLLDAQDLGFRNDFDGFVMTNHGGDYNLRRIAINGGN